MNKREDQLLVLMFGTEQGLSVLFDSQVIWCQVQADVLFKRLLECLLLGIV